MAKLPRMYVESKLFPRGRLKDGIKKTTVPDPVKEDLHPDEEDGIGSTVSNEEDKVAKSRTAQAIDLFKAGADQESAGRRTFIDEEQAKRQTEQERYPLGVGGASTPDLPERGRDWKGEVDDVPDVPEDDEVDIGKTPMEEALARLSDAKKAFSGAPRFNPGRVVPPRELEFLQRQGYSRNDIANGNFKITPTMRAEFNQEVTSSVQKSLGALEQWRNQWLKK